MAYNPIKRLRQWFFDTNIPTEPRIFLDGNGNTVTRQVKTRLAKGHFPKEETHQDLLASVFFKSAGADLQDIATNDDIKDELNIEKVVKPNQLPELENVVDVLDFTTPDSQPADTNPIFTGNVYNREKRTHNNKNKYSWRFTRAFLGWLITRVIPNGGTTGQVLTKTTNSNLNFSWQSLPVSPNQLPPFVSANRILFTNATNNGAEWRNRDYYTQTESNNLLATESNARILGDTNLQNELNTTQIGAGLNGDGTYIPLGLADPIIGGAFSLANADEILSNAVLALQTLTNNIRNGATLPQSSLQGLQDQINNLGGGNSVKINLPADNSEILSTTLGYWKKANQVFIEGFFVIDNTNSVISINYTSSLPPSIIPNNIKRFGIIWFDNTANDYKSGQVQINTVGQMTLYPSTNLPIFNNDEIYLNITYLV